MPLTSSAPISINELFSGEEFKILKEHLQPQDTARFVESWTVLEDEDLDPYEQPTKVAHWGYGRDPDHKHVFTHKHVEMAWTRFVIPLVYLAQTVGGGAVAFQKGFADPRANPATFIFTFKPYAGSGGLKAGERL